MSRISQTAGARARRRRSRDGRPGAGAVTTQKLSAALANELVANRSRSARRRVPVVAVVVDLDGVRRPCCAATARRSTRWTTPTTRLHRASLTLARKEKPPRPSPTACQGRPTTVPQTPLPNVTYAQGGVAIMAGERRSRVSE